VKFSTLEEAKAHQKLHGGTLYRPRVYERPRKRKRSPGRSHAVEALPPAPLPLPQEGIEDSSSPICQQEMNQ